MVTVTVNDMLTVCVPSVTNTVNTCGLVPTSSGPVAHVMMPLFESIAAPVAVDAESE